jgi:hypothetical protein
MCDQMSNLIFIKMSFKIKKKTKYIKDKNIIYLDTLYCG